MVIISKNVKQSPNTWLESIIKSLAIKLCRMLSTMYWEITWQKKVDRTKTVYQLLKLSIQELKINVLERQFFCPGKDGYST